MKEDAFFTILGLHGIGLSQKEQATLKHEFSKGGSIKYKEALHRINVDLDYAVLHEEKWTINKPQTASLTGKVVSHASKMSLTANNLDALKKSVCGDNRSTQTKSLASKVESVQQSAASKSEAQKSVFDNASNVQTEKPTT